MAWDAKAFMEDYERGECDNVRCLNRKDTLIETGADLRDAQAVLCLLMQYAKGRLDVSDDMRRVYVTIARHNLGETFEPGGSADRFIITPEMVNLTSSPGQR